MKIDIPYGINSMQIGTIRILTLKLRFNSATWSWIKPELDSCDSVLRESITVTMRNSYTTIQLTTSSYDMLNAVWIAIQNGQIAQQEFALECWKENYIRVDASKLDKPSIAAVVDNIDQI